MNSPRPEWTGLWGNSAASSVHTTEDRDGMLHSGMEGGVNQSYAALDAVLATLS